MRELLGTSLLLVQAMLLVPLILEVWRSRKATGISLLGEMLWVTVGAGWFLYGHMLHSNVLMTSGSLAFIGSATVSALIWHDAPAQHRLCALYLSLSVAAALLCMTVLWKSVGLSTALSLLGIVQFIPQIRVSLRDLRNDGAEGVPMVGTGMRALYTLTWAVYAGAWFIWGTSFHEINFPLAIWGIMGFFTFTLQWAAGRQSNISHGIQSID